MYRNLGQHTPLKYSVMQDGLVVAHIDSIDLVDCEFRVNVGRREKFRQQKQKTVHAFIIGYIDKDPAVSLRSDIKVTYNPYIDDYFQYDGGPIYEAHYVSINNQGVFIL